MHDLLRLRHDRWSRQDEVVCVKQGPHRSFLSNVMTVCMSVTSPHGQDEEDILHPSLTVSFILRAGVAQLGRVEDLIDQNAYN